MSDIFISYAHEDETRIQHIADAFELHGWTVFWDRHIRAGQTWRSLIDQELIDARCVVVAWSQHSIRSRWVTEEAEAGQQRGILVPILLDSVEPPIGFRGIQVADLVDWTLDPSSSHFNKLVQDINVVATPERSITTREHDSRLPLHEYLKRITSLFEEQPLVRSFVPLSAEDSAGNAIVDVLEDLKQTIRADPRAFALVLGDYGSGKTSLMYKLAYDLAQEVLSGSPNTPAPLYLSLGFARGKPSIVHAFSDFVSRYGVDLTAKFLRDLLNAMPNLVFILDGFDEMANRTEWSEVPAILDKLSEIQVSAGIRLVLTSRTTFFRERLDEKLVPATTRRYLTPMNDRQIIEYVSKQEPERVTQIEAFLDRRPEIRGLCRFPIHLMLCVDYLAEHNPETNNVQPIEIYSSFIDKNLLINASTNPDWGLTERRATVRRLAFQWFRDETFEVSANDLRRELQQEIPDLSVAEYRSLAIQLLNCSFFMRIVDRYRFFHYSFLEFFAAETLVRNLYNGELDSWNERPFYAELFDFMAQMIAKEGITSLPTDSVVECDLELVQSNFLATMYRQPMDQVWPVFDRLLRGSNYPLVRCVASCGIGLSATAKSIASLKSAHEREENSILRAIFGTLIRGLEETTDPGVAEPTDVGRFTPLAATDAEAVLVTERNSFALEAYRKALLIGDQRWTSTVAAIYLLGASGDTESTKAIERICSQSQLSAVRQAYQDVLPLINEHHKAAE